MSSTDSTYIHPSAFVEPGAALGAGAKAWHQVHVRSGATVGERTSLGKNVFVDAEVSIGSGCKIQNNVSVYRGVTLEDDVFVGPSAVFTNDLHPRAFKSDWTITPTVVGRGASIGANATIVCGNDIGELALVAAGAVVTRPVRAHELVGGNPARHLGWVCRCARTASKAVDPPDSFWCGTCAEGGPA